jgi:hypothetical protein
MSQYNRNQFNTKSKSASNEVKKFCKVCQDAGKPESMYTSHFVRDRPGPDGKVICPTLLSQNCRGCGKSGHTYKYCKIVIQQDLEKKQQEKWEENEKKWKSAEKKLEDSVKRPGVSQKKETVIKVFKGAYASILLSSSSDEDSDDDLPKAKAKAAHPKVKESKSRVRFVEEDELEKPIVEMNPNSYAARLLRPVVLPPKEVKEVPPPSMEEFVIQEPQEPIGFKIVSLPKSAPKPVRVEESLVAPRKVITEEERQKLKEKIKTVMAEPCKWDAESSDDDSEDDSEDEEEKEKVIQCIAAYLQTTSHNEPRIFKKEESVKTNVFIELKDAWSDDEA